MRRSAFRLRRHPFDFAAARLRSGCSALLAAALLLLGACSPQWVAVTTTLDRVVLSVTGAAGEVLIVGGAQGNGAATLAKKFDGHAWADLPLSSPDTATLWWVARVGDSTFMVGEHGTVYRDGVKAPALTDATLFGVWGASSDEVWAVGGSPLGNGDNDVLLRFDGASWAKVPSPEPLGVAYFKVWGSARDDVWVVGQQGAAFHYDGSAWSRVTTGVRSTLLTVTGRSRSDVWAVGGPPAVLARFDGTVWKNEELPFEASGLTGIAMGPDDEVVVVGLAGVRWRRVLGTWVDDSDQPALGDLHATWVPSQGDAWAVGGNYIAVDAQTVRKGIVAHFGGGAVSAP